MDWLQPFDGKVEIDFRVDGVVAEISFALSGRTA